MEKNQMTATKQPPFLVVDTSTGECTDVDFDILAEYNRMIEAGNKLYDDYVELLEAINKEVAKRNDLVDEYAELTYKYDDLRDYNNEILESIKVYPKRKRTRELISDRAKKKEGSIPNTLSTREKETQKKEKNMFMWCVRDIVQRLDKLTKADLTRFTLLATYANSDGLIVNSNGSPMTREQLLKKMLVPKTTFNAFVNFLKGQNMLEEKDGVIKIDNSCLFKGSVKEKKLEGELLFKVCIPTYRSLCASMGSSGYTKIGNVFYLLPHINPHYNALVSDSHTIDTHFMKGITLKEFAEKMNYSQKVVNNLISDMDDVIYTHKKSEPLKLFVFDRQDGLVKVFVNPSIFAVANKLYLDSDERIIFSVT